MRLVCFDTPALIYLLDPPTPKGLSPQQIEERQKLGSKVKGMVEYLSNQGTHILIPAIVVAEYLTKVPNDLHEDVINSLSPKFIIAPFDTKTASIAADIRNKKAAVLGGIPSQQKECLKADILIVATALQHNCKIIYTNDNDMNTIASGYIEVKLIKDLLFESLF